MVISIINEKGGSGKTTLAVNLAARLTLDGDSVLLIDADPQKSTEVFSDMRSQNNLKPIFSNVCKTGVSLGDEIKLMKDKFDSIIIDTGGRDSKEMRKAILNSNIVIIPTLPSQYDVSVLYHMFELIIEAKEFNENLLVFVVTNRVSPNPFLQKDLQNLQNYIKDLQVEKNISDIYLLDSVIYERQAYRKAVIEGKSINEFDNSKASEDFEQFYQELLEKTNKFIKG
ncbi:AAA family ATPase [Campylobacter sp. MG1]|uniref:AAA family ATPase n=1 Tax=Campylobacter sp. MG1 TaxID=2976332 RepID=UPI00226CEE0A|nr:AAA family ATPase [Campylobacter sp. MG1]